MLLIMKLKRYAEEDLEALLLRGAFIVEMKHPVGYRHSESFTLKKTLHDC